MKFNDYLNKSFSLKESRSKYSLEDWESEGVREFKPVGKPVGKGKASEYDDPDWIPLDKEYQKYACAKCQYPLVGYGKNIPWAGFIMSKQTNVIPCPNCGAVNDIDYFHGYINMDGTINKRHFIRTTPVYDNIGDMQKNILVKLDVS